MTDLPTGLAELFEAERRAPGAPPGTRERVHARLVAPLAPGGAAAAAAVATQATVLKIVIGLVVVAGAGLGIGRMVLKGTRPATVAVAAPAPAPVAVAGPAPEAVAVAEPEAAADAGTRTPVVPRPASPADTLAAERMLLDEGLTALQAGDVASALRAIHAHATRYPGGVLVEEREVLAVRALVAAGRRDEARARAHRFRRRFPDSIQLDVIRSLTDRDPTGQ